MLKTAAIDSDGVVQTGTAICRLSWRKSSRPKAADNAQPTSSADSTA